jgi:23S rRNA (cytidine1920-2'-O)/16S rRNA (cytidine1409-2'-O)-methyltransferase
MKKERIDRLLQDRGLADSRNKAQAMIMSGVVLANDRRVEKSSETFGPDVQLRIKGDSPESRYASRAGLKLEAALNQFNIDPTGMICLDVGSSTGGFTDCLLQHGAERIVAVDSGTNQLIWRLRNDPRVEVRENTNARALTPADFATLFDLIVIDVSFISLTKILPALIALMKPVGRMICLIKPQFEVGRGEVGKGGIVRDPEKHERVVAEINEFLLSPDSAYVASSIRRYSGPKVIRNFLLYMTEPSETSETKKPLAEGQDFYFENGLMVLTAKYLKDRGYCCGNLCRHCPYSRDEQAAALKKKLV